MDKGARKELDWFFSFLNADLERMSMEEQVEIGRQMAKVLGLGWQDGGFLLTFSPEVAIRLVGHRGENLKRLQQFLKGAFLEIMLRFRAAKRQRNTLENTWTDKKDADKIRRLYSIDLPVRLTLSFTLDEIPQIDPQTETESRLMTRWEPGALDKAIFQLRTLAPKDEDHLLYRFLQDLNWVPRSSLKECKECGGWFVHTSHRERKFCSNRCAAKKANRVRYRRLKADNPDVYENEKEKGRERSKKSYNERKKKELGKGVKVSKYPRKSKQEED